MKTSNSRRGGGGGDSYNNISKTPATDSLSKPFELVEIRNGRVILNSDLLEEVRDGGCPYD